MLQPKTSPGFVFYRCLLKSSLLCACACARACMGKRVLEGAERGGGDTQVSLLSQALIPS